MVLKRRIANDMAESGIKLIEDYNSILTTDKEEINRAIKCK